MEKTFKKLGNYLLGKNYTKAHIIEVFEESEKYYLPIMFIDAKLELDIAEFCRNEGIEFTEFLGTFKAEELF